MTWFPRAVKIISNGEWLSLSVVAAEPQSSLQEEFRAAARSMEYKLPAALRFFSCFDFLVIMYWNNDKSMRL